MLTSTDISHYLSNIKCKNYDFAFSAADEILSSNEALLGSGFLIWIKFRRIDSTSGKLEEAQNMRKYYVENWRDEDYVMRTCFIAALALEEHELREHFLYKGERKMDPHERLVDAVRQ